MTVVDSFFNFFLSFSPKNYPPKNFLPYPPIFLYPYIFFIFWKIPKLPLQKSQTLYQNVWKITFNARSNAQPVVHDLTSSANIESSIGDALAYADKNSSDVVCNLRTSQPHRKRVPVSKRKGPRVRSDKDVSSAEENRSISSSSETWVHDTVKIFKNNKPLVISVDVFSFVSTFPFYINLEFFFPLPLLIFF